MTLEARSSALPARVTFAANNGEIGGGEVMLLSMATAARTHGYDVRVVGPQAENGVVERARSAGFVAHALAGDRRTYLSELRRWDRERRGLLWCNGLAPALATTGHARRVIHLHRIPEGAQRMVARIARTGTLGTIVPSIFMGTKIKGARVLANWSAASPLVNRVDTRCARIGFIGRMGADKGVHLAAASVSQLRAAGWDASLVLAGEPRFVNDTSRAIVERSLSELEPHVHIMGWVSPEEFHAAVDVVVVPSNWPEPFGLTVTEAMAARVPVIVSDAGALPEVVGEGHPWIARAGDVQSLTDTLEQFLTASPEVVDTAIDVAHRRWLAHYSPEAGEARFVSLLDDLLAKSGDEQ